MNPVTISCVLMPSIWDGNLSVKGEKQKPLAESLSLCFTVPIVFISSRRCTHAHAHTHTHMHITDRLARSTGIFVRTYTSSVPTLDRLHTVWYPKLFALIVYRISVIDNLSVNIVSNSYLACTKCSVLLLATIHRIYNRQNQQIEYRTIAEKLIILIPKLFIFDEKRQICSIAHGIRTYEKNMKLSWQNFAKSSINVASQSTFGCFGFYQMPTALNFRNIIENNLLPFFKVTSEWGRNGVP